MQNIRKIITNEPNRKIQPEKYLCVVRQVNQDKQTNHLPYNYDNAFQLQKRFQRKNNLNDNQRSIKTIRKSVESNSFRGHQRKASRDKQGDIMHSSHAVNSDCINENLGLNPVFGGMRTTQSMIFEPIYVPTSDVVKKSHKQTKYENTNESSRVQETGIKNLTSMQLLFGDEKQCVSDEKVEEKEDEKKKKENGVRFSMGGQKKQNTSLNNLINNPLHQKQIFKLNENIKRLQRRTTQLQGIIEEYKLREAYNHNLIHENTKLKKQCENFQKEHPILIKKNAQLAEEISNLIKQKKHMVKQISQLSIKNLNKDIYQLQSYREISLEQQLKQAKKQLQNNKNERERQLEYRINTIEGQYGQIQSQFKKLSIGYRVMLRKNQLAQKERDLNINSAYQLQQIRKKYKKLSEEYKKLKRNYLMTLDELSNEKRKNKKNQVRYSDMMDTVGGHTELTKTWNKFERYENNSELSSSVEFQLSL